MEMSNKELQESKSWYLSAVESSLILRGMTKEEAMNLIDAYKLQERLDAFPDIQMHYDIEATVNEILEVAKIKEAFTNTGVHSDYSEESLSAGDASSNANISRFISTFNR